MTYLHANRKSCDKDVVFIYFQVISLIKIMLGNRYYTLIILKLKFNCFLEVRGYKIKKLHCA